MLLVVGSTGEKPPAGVRESWLFIFLPSDYAPGEARCGHPKPYSLTARPQPERKIGQTITCFGHKKAPRHPRELVSGIPETSE